MNKSPNPYSDVVRVRTTPAQGAQLRETSQRAGVPVSELIRTAVTWYLSAPSVKANPQQSNKV